MERDIIFQGDAAALVPPSGGRVHYYGLNLASAAFTIAEIMRRRPAAFLVTLPTPVEAEDFIRDLEFFWPEGASAGAVLLLPGYEIKPFSGESPSGDLVFSRLHALSSLASGRRPLVVATSAAGALQRSLPRHVLSRATEYIEAEEEVDRDKLMLFLARTGYFPVNMVQAKGDFSVRGGIFDVYPPGGKRPVRAEFFGDFVESLREFRTSDQRSVADLTEQVLLPANEIVYLPGFAEATSERFRSLAVRHGWIDLLWASKVQAMAEEQFFPGIESFLPLFHDSLEAVFDYAGPEVTRIIFDPPRLNEAAEKHLARLKRHMEVIRAEERPHLPLETLYLSPQELTDAFKNRTTIEIHELPMDAGPERGDLHFKVESNQDLRVLMETAHTGAGLLAPLAARVKAWMNRGLKTALVCHTREQAVRLSELLNDYGVYAAVLRDDDAPSGDPAPFSIRVGFLSSGFVMAAVGVAFVTENELFGPRRRVTRRAVEEIRGIHLSSFQDLTVGDFVVHNDHGVGQYLGLVKLDAGGRANDYLHLAYKGNDKLYVPVERFDAVEKYVGLEGRAPRLDKLGGTAWERTKARVKAGIKEMTEELLQLYAARQVKKGYAYSGRDSFFREFEAAFPYEETPDQLSAIDDVLKDMVAEKPMDRLVCGDVGYGKTEVSLRAAFKAVQDGRQVAILVPTTVLAEQHYQTFVQRMRNYPLTVEVLSRFKTRAEQKDILNRLSQGRVDVIVGTHRLVQKDVVFKDLGLLVIDEEHRFGVEAKEKLKKLRTEVDVLVLSATPIPRTMHMSLSGIRDLSVIETPPQDRLSVKSYLLKFDETIVCEAIDRELERGGQVFFVHNRVKDIDLLAGRFKKLMPLVRFGVAHGQLKERELEDVMLRFLRREIDVLVTTAIIESGLDFPSTNTIVINNADRFGLAQIYQLRGRVGRSNEQAYAYLLVDSEESLTRDARKRLRALLDFSELGSGFRIALHDLQIRGAGNLLGSAQSGQIAAVGYEMYKQLMEQTIHQLKGEPPDEDIEPEMLIGLPAFIPESYVPDTEQRLVHYRRLSAIKDPGEISDLAAMFLDRYGQAPLEVENLLLVMELKYWLKKARIKRMEMGQNGITLTYTESGPADIERVLGLVDKYQDKIRFYPEGRLFLRMDVMDGPNGMKNVKNILKGLA